MQCPCDFLHWDPTSWTQFLSPSHPIWYRPASGYTSRHSWRVLRNIISITLFKSVGSVYSEHAEMYQVTSVSSAAPMEFSPYPSHTSQQNSNYLSLFYWVRHHSQTKIYVSNLKLDSAVDIFWLHPFFSSLTSGTQWVYHYLAVIYKSICAKMAKCRLSIGQASVLKHRCQATMSSDDLITLRKQDSWQKSFIIMRQ